MITRVRFVRAADPIGQLLIQSAGDLWLGDDEIPEHDAGDEYARGQIELLTECVRFLTDEEIESGSCDVETSWFRAWALMQAAALGRLHDTDVAVVQSMFSNKFAGRYVDDYLKGDAAARAAFASDVRDYEAKERTHG